MSETNVSWVVQFKDILLEIDHWQNWQRYQSEENAQIELAYRSGDSSGIVWRIVKETVTLEVVAPNVAVRDLVSRKDSI